MRVNPNEVLACWYQPDQPGMRRGMCTREFLEPYVSRVIPCVPRLSQVTDIRYRFGDSVVDWWYMELSDRPGVYVATSSFWLRLVPSLVPSLDTCA